MSFTELPFLTVLIVAMFIVGTGFSWTVRKSVLLGLSYFFYAAFHPIFVLLLLVSTLVDATCAQGIHKSQRQLIRRALLALSLLGNLGVLVAFKYSGFLLDNAQALGFFPQLKAPDFLLPLGISFYTFQTLSYTLDIYWKKRAPAKSFLDFALYVSFFPQLVAGPIVRATTMLTQFQEPPTQPLAVRLERGVSLLVIGFFQKHALADGWLAPITEAVFDNGAIPQSQDVVLATMAFTAQILFDFAGYSTMALGAAACLGFSLPVNFRFPYASRGFSDFWRRWHITLSQWLRDYLYIPLGGNRHGALRTALALSITMLLGGLWHGAAWTFVIWGALHGAFLVAERALKALTPWRPPVWASQLITLVGVMFAWIFFRSSSWQKATVLVQALFGQSSAPKALLSNFDAATTVTLFIAVLVVHTLMRDKSLTELLEKTHPTLRGACLGVLFLLALFTGGEDRAFIYFQF